MLQHSKCMPYLLRSCSPRCTCSIGGNIKISWHDGPSCSRPLLPLPLCNTYTSVSHEPHQVCNARQRAHQRKVQQSSVLPVMLSIMFSARCAIRCKPVAVPALLACCLGMCCLCCWLHGKQMLVALDHLQAAAGGGGLLQVVRWASGGVLEVVWWTSWGVLAVVILNGVVGVVGQAV